MRASKKLQSKAGQYGASDEALYQAVKLLCGSMLAGKVPDELKEEHLLLSAKLGTIAAMSMINGKRPSQAALRQFKCHRCAAIDKALEETAPGTF